MSTHQYTQEEFEEFRQVVNSGDYSRVEQMHPNMTYGKWEPFSGRFTLNTGWHYRITSPPPEPDGWSEIKHVRTDVWYYSSRSSQICRVASVGDGGIYLGRLYFISWPNLKDWCWTRDHENFYSCTVVPQLVSKP